MNYGFSLELEKAHKSPEDKVFGSASYPCIALISEEERLKHLPDGEVQIAREDVMDCASRGPINIWEAKFTYLIRNKKLPLKHELWLREKGYVTAKGTVEFSDAFVAINSGTTKQGNSLKAPLEAARKMGLIPKHLLPKENWMSFEDYHNPERITESMKELGKEFLSYFVLNYEQVSEKDYGELLEKDMLDVAGYAWPVEVNGVFPRSDLDPNHVFVVWSRPKYRVFDNYKDTDGDFIKFLASDYDLLDYGYRVTVNLEKVDQVKKNLFQTFLGFLKRYFYEIFA